MLDFILTLAKIIGIPLGVVLVIALFSRRGSEWRVLLRSPAGLIIACAAGVAVIIRLLYDVASQRYESPLLVFCIVFGCAGVFGLANLLHRVEKKTLALLLVFLLLGGSFISYLVFRRDNKIFTKEFANNLSLSRSDTSRPAVLIDLDGRGSQIYFYREDEAGGMKYMDLSTGASEGKYFVSIADKINELRLVSGDIYIFYRQNREERNHFQDNLMRYWSEFPFNVIARHDEGKRINWLYQYQAPAVEYSGDASLLANRNDNPLQFCLPDQCYWLPNTEFSLYFDNIILTLATNRYLFKIEEPVGRTGSRAWRYTTPNGPVAQPITVSVYDERNRLYGKKTMRMVIPKARVGADQNSGSLILIGGWLLDRTQMAGELYRILAKQGNSLAMLGSHSGLGRPAVLFGHEGHEGWTWSRYVSEWAPDRVDEKGKLKSSPFLFLGIAGKPELNIGRFKAGLKPEKPLKYLVFICEAIHLHDSIFTISSIWDREIIALDRLIAEFKKQYPELKIGIVPPIPAAGSQDAFRVYGNKSRWEFRQLQHYALNRIMQHYRHQEAQGIYIIPTYLNVDVSRDYLNEAQMHPLLLNANGAIQSAKAIAAWLLYCESGE
jgi:hypothetical protein